ncbi:MAG TPA: Hsp20/alpha crystallin family protein [Vicinamibacterales bacterium]|jgi:HSP20 family protein|nr:Hsp20/alpha crystallin family protein [Vicinamibacterales bacterium]
MTLVRWNPVRDLASMEIDRLNRMFDEFYRTGRGWAPAVDIYETNDREFVIKAELPEMKREQITLTFENNVLTLSGERSSEFDANTGSVHRTERAFGKFTRSFTLPATVDGNRISAAYKDGVLTVRIPQREEAKPKQIAVGE